MILKNDIVLISCFASKYRSHIDVVGEIGYNMQSIFSWSQCLLLLYREPEKLLCCGRYQRVTYQMFCQIRTIWQHVMLLFLCMTGTVRSVFVWSCFGTFKLLDWCFTPCFSVISIFMSSKLKWCIEEMLVSSVFMHKLTT